MKARVTVPSAGRTRNSSVLEATKSRHVVAANEQAAAATADDNCDAQRAGPVRGGGTAIDFEPTLRQA